jgi:hypothetical protein
MFGWFSFSIAQTFEIQKEFINGDLIFTWTNVSAIDNDVQIKIDGQYVTFRENGQNSTWSRISGDEYTVKDMWQYQSVEITVFEYMSKFRSRSKAHYKSSGKCLILETH